MNHAGVSQIFFSDTFSTAPEQIAQNVLPRVTQDDSCADQMQGAMAAACLVAVLESVCAREMQTHLDNNEEILVLSSMQCQYRAPIAPGALVRISGWVTDVADQEATFCVQASDEQEIVCEGLIRLTIVQRSQIEKRLQHKRDAIARRELFASA